MSFLKKKQTSQIPPDQPNPTRLHWENYKKKKPRYFN